MLLIALPLRRGNDASPAYALSRGEDRRVLADLFWIAVEDQGALLHPAVGGPWPYPHPDDPQRKDFVIGKKPDQCQRMEETTVMRGERIGT